MAFVSGAAGKAVAELAVGQKRAGHHVTVVTSKTPAGGVMNQAALIRKLSDGGVFVHAVGRGDERAKLAAFATGIPGVEQAGHRDKRRPVPVSRGNREAILAQQPPPRARSDASQVVMRQAPAMPERGGHPD